MKHSLLVCAIFCSSLLAAQEPSQSNQAVPAPTSIKLVVNVADKHGKPVADLSKESFRITTVDQKPIALDVLEPAETCPIVFALVIDISGSNFNKIDLLSTYALQLFDSVDSTKNRGFLVLFNNKTHYSKQFVTRDLLEQSLPHLNVSGGTALYDAVVEASKLVREAAPDNDGSPFVRRLLLVITDGEDNESHVRIDRAINATLQARVTMVALRLFDRHPSHDISQSEHYLDRLVTATGGRTVVLDSPRDISQDIKDFLRSEYVLSFTPNSRMKAGSFQELKIKSSDPRKLAIKSPSGFYTK